jgi:hypothetical protein
VLVIARHDCNVQLPLPLYSGADSVLSPDGSRLYAVTRYNDTPAVAVIALTYAPARAG